MTRRVCSLSILRRMRITLVRSILRIKQTCNQYHSLLFSQIFLYFSSSSSCLFTSSSSRFPPCPLHCPLTLPLSSPLPPHCTPCPLPSPLSPHFTPCPLPSPLTLPLVLSPPPSLYPFSFPSFLTSFLTFTLSLFRVLSEQN